MKWQSARAESLSETRRDRRTGEIFVDFAIILDDPEVPFRRLLTALGSFLIHVELWLSTFLLLLLPIRP